MSLIRITATILLSFGFFLFVSAQGSGLSSADLRKLDMDRVSDAEVTDYFKKASKAGLSEGQVYEVLHSRGLPEVQIGKLRDRISILGLTQKAAKDAEEGGVTEANEGTQRQVDGMNLEKIMQPTDYNPRIFGSELFTSTSTTFEPNLRIATPANYVLGPDDEIIINVYGYSEKTYRQKVSADGNIYIENVGPVQLNGLTLDEAEIKIKGRLSSTIYKAMKTGATNMKLTLSSIRSIRITIIGQAKKPGTFTVSSLTTLFNALYLCGGPTDQGSFRNIELIRGNKVVRIVDLYNFLEKGDRSDNLILQEQDIIRIPFYESRLVFSGFVKRQGIYELKKTESLDKVFKYTGGFSDIAYRKSVNIYQINGERLSLKTLTVDSFPVYFPGSADSIVVNTATMRYANRVRINGAVMRPGDYELLEGMNLNQLIQKAGGLREDAFIGAANILRIGDDLGAENVSFSPAKVLEGNDNILLKKEDEVIINSIYELRDKYTVGVEGEVSKPGIFAWRKDFRLRDLILLAGGVKEAASANNTVQIEVSRRVRKADVQGTEFKQSEIIKIISDINLTDTGAQLVLLPFDMVVVRPQPGYQRQHSVYINGPVMYPGRYFLEKSGERITDVLGRAGGFKSFADSNSVFIRRYKGDQADMEGKAALLAKLSGIAADSIMNSPALLSEIQSNYESLSINLGKAFGNKGGNDDIIMEPGDIILVGQNSSLVKISGEVYFPTLIPFEKNTTARYYIKRTGDFTKQARKGQTFVIYPDGLAKGVKKFLFIKSWPKVTPKSEIYVPSKGDKNKEGLSTTELIALSSILATLGTLIVTVINSN